MDSGTKRAFCLWHRRAGKDKTLWNYMIKRAVMEVGIYYYFLPTYEQARKIIWEGRDSRTGLSFLDHVPKEILRSKNEQQMKIELLNGSLIRLVGTDKFDSIRGTNPIGCVFSEFAFQNPQAWGVIRPILDENGGWAIFNTTPNGENHCFDLCQRVKGSDNWFVETLTIEDTGAIPMEAIQHAKDEGADDDTIAREYYCSFDASVLGAYYGEQMKHARTQGRITSIGFQPSSLVYTAWDLGRDDSTVIWFFQKIGNQFYFIDYLEENGHPMSHYAQALLEKKLDHGYVYGGIYLPHDAESKTISTEFSPKETLINFGISNDIIHVVPRTQNLKIDIEASRSMLPMCWFDEEKCSDGIAALRSYSRKYDQVKKVFSNTPDHNWASHGADAFRTFAVGWKGEKERKKRTIAKTKVWNPLTQSYI